MDTFGSDLYLRAVLVLVGIVALLLIASVVVRRLGLSGRFAAGGKRRLGIVESAAIDGKKRLVLLRRDDVEHLVMVGPEGTTVIETGIRAAIIPGEGI